MATSQKADLEKLSQYVVVHPDDYERRWTLAKKLYMAWEYNDALKHLLILKKNWSKKLNVLRYLAATYYRLGLYDEAIAELLAITQVWPNEVAVWEQLARVNEIAGRTADAAHTWEQVVRISPSHPTAARSVQRLRSPSPDEKREDLRLRDSDSGIDLSPYRICNNCGAQNSDEFERCWQCHAALHTGDAPIDSVHAAKARKTRTWLRTFVGGMATVAAVTASVYVTLHILRVLHQGAPSGYGPVYDLLAQKLFIPRLVCAVALVFAWPASLWIAFRSTGGRPMPWPSLFGAGLLLSSLTYLFMWTPVHWLIYAPAVPALVSLIVILSFSGGKLARALAAWLSHGVFVLSAALCTFAAIAGIQPIVQLPAIADYNDKMLAISTPDSLTFFTSAGTDDCFVKWFSTNSSWLDEQGDTVIIEAVPDEAGAKVELALMSGEEPIGMPGSVENTIVARVTPERFYRLHVNAPDGVSFSVRSRSVLQPVTKSTEAAR